MELYKLTIHEAKDLLAKKEISASELTKSTIDRIQAVENKINAFITLNFDEALNQAKEVDKAIHEGSELPPLAGIPMALKDNMCTLGIKTTCASKMLENFVPPYDATVAKRLKEQKSILLGKLNMDEFAMGSSTENSAFKKTCNPWDITRVPGGSSGGSAASVIADQAFFSLGSDTGGSIRQPASFCGLVGFKPTYGAVSRYGLIAFASSLDQIGPFTKDVTDCALVLNAITGHDHMDATSANIDYPDYTKALKDDVKGWKIGVPKEYFGEGLDPEVKKAIEKAIATFESLGAEIEEISLPHTEYALSVYYILACAEASSNLARYDGVKYGYRASEYDDLDSLYKNTRTQGFGPEVKRRIMLGNYALSSGYYDAYYLKALKVRTLIKEDFDKAFKKYDIILSPTSPTTAFTFGAKTDPLQMYLSDVYTIPVNIAGLPGMSMPCGFDSRGLPIGMQLIGKAFEEDKLLQAAYTFEQNTDYHIKKPAVNWG
ncbi:MAG: Asp-tRNA(Asn)/Glu-tRNA(Gln) amidotransferase subunit GatA [Xylanivirga thermophila]|jgi:aspartyl-tRNA(Asn)/glutamyl-tRNA(Gln) amidotransferase subunit A|uniref:Asp-tRNA(Asn)/Glu-tRNA(Gln) amidotransferase subunit GatA n=1 Tax=Xylanivirga thermophila TaxID=2496273 RepID=UPI0039F48A89